MALSKGFELATLGSGLDVNQSTGEIVTISMDTDVVSEGTTNLYFTNERVDDRVANLLVGGSNITVTYDDTAGTLTIAGQSGYSDSDVDTHLNVSGASANQVLAWSGTDYIWANNPEPNGDSNRVVYDLADPTNTIVLDPGSTSGTATYKGDVLKPDGTVIVDVSSTSTTFTGGLLGNVYGDVYNPTGANKILESGTGNLDSALTVDTITTSSNVIIGGNLTVNGTTTTLNTATLDVEDLNITVASGAADSAAANGAGLTVDGAGANITYTHATTSWDFNKPVNVTGAITATGISQFSDVNIPDNNAIRFGNSQDLQIYHDGTDSFIKNDTGRFRIYGDQGNTAISVAAGYGNAVSLEYANSTKLSTTSAGVTMQYGATFGSGGDTILSNSANGTSGQKYFQAKNTFQSGFTDGSIFGGMSFRNSRNGANPGITGYIRGVANGTSGNMNLEIITGTAGSLTQKVLIKDAGVDITGNIGVTGTVDGVDIASRDAILTSTTTTANAALPKTGGTMTGDISFGDNDKAIFGASSNLQIFYDPFTFMNWITSNSRVYLNSTGNVWLGGPNVVIGNGGASEYYVECIENGEVKLFYDNALKLATTSTGIDVTGTTTTDQYLYVNSPNGTQLQLRSEDTYTTLGAGNRNLNISANRTIFLDDAFAEVMRIQDDGKVGIGTATPLHPLHVEGTIYSTNNIQLNSTKQVMFGNGNQYVKGTNDTSIEIGTGGTATITATHAGNVGIGTTSPATILDISTSGANGITLNEDTNNASLSGRIFLNNGTANKAISIMNNGNNLSISTGATPGSGSGSEKVRVLENGFVGIGTTTPSEKLHVEGNISVTGTVDGRDVSVDGTKLDGIESGATADQTAAQILTAVKTVDGSGSGLDADLLDGQQGSYYQKKTTVQDAVPSGATGEFWYESDTSVLHVYYGGAWVDVAPGLQTSDNLQINSLGVGTAASSTAGEIRATNDITAYYSDARLKNFESTIDSALDKVKQLNGYYFTENEIAKELGYANDKRQVGVSAQEVEAVLPEIVTEAPISDEYLTVKYEKLAPLFIEAIKEIDEKYQAKQDQQQAQIDMLMEEVKKLKGN